MTREEVRHNYAVRVKGKLQNSDKLQADLSGAYTFSTKKMELKPVTPIKQAGFKTVYTIRLGYTGNNIFINHSDYSTIKETYKQNGCLVTFWYNHKEYKFEISDQKKVRIYKVLT